MRRIVSVRLDAHDDAWLRAQSDNVTEVLRRLITQARRADEAELLADVTKTPSLRKGNRRVRGDH